MLKNSVSISYYPHINNYIRLYIIEKNDDLNLIFLLVYRLLVVLTIANNRFYTMMMMMTDFFFDRLTKKSINHESNQSIHLEYNLTPKLTIVKIL